MPKFYLSFADDKSSLGGTLVEAENSISAIQEVIRRGLNPGGEAMIIPVQEPCPPSLLGYLNRLVSQEELIKDGAKRLGDLR